jgi:hypothetical protein
MKRKTILDFEESLKPIFDEIDDFLEEKYGKLYTLHPARAKRNTTSSKNQDGLFNVGASFSPGFGSEFGRGYVIEIDLRTLQTVQENIRLRIEEESIDLLKNKLTERYPERDLKVRRDGTVYKIFGTLSEST